MEDPILYPSSQEFVDLSLKMFKSLPKTGKPLINEWTVLSTIIEFNSKLNISKVVALGTGTKSIGHTNMCALGLILNDSHAEVISRRAFLRYILNQMKISKSEILSYNEQKKIFQLEDHISYHFFSTQPPCGDACILEEFSINNKDNCGKPLPKKLKLEFDSIHKNEVFTGAKLLDTNIVDSMDQKIGALRTKPGRGIRSLSLSCSDKISKWNVMGLQGALLDILIEKPIYLKTYNFCCDFNTASMKRAIYKRWSRKKINFNLNKFKMQKPEIRSCESAAFEFSDNIQEKNPSPNSIIWSSISNDKTSFEVSVGGRKQGITKKLYGKEESSVKICKLSILHEFQNILKLRPDLVVKLDLNENLLKNKTYADYKNLATNYQAAWNFLKQKCFKEWLEKNKLMK